MGKKLLLCGFGLLLLTGCWDRVEIEERGFVISAAVSSAEDNGDFERGKDKLAVTLQIAIPSKMVGAGEEGIKNRPFFLIKTTERTNFGSNRNIPSRRSRLLNYEHLKVVLLDDDLVKQDMLKYTLDFYIRDHEMRRNTELFVVEGDADKVLEDDRPPEPLTGLALVSTVENDVRDLSMIEKATISDVTNKLLANVAFVIPRVIERQATSYRIRGGAIFNGAGEFKAMLTDEKAIGYNLLLGDMKNAIVETSLENQEDIFVFETGRMSSSIDASVNDQGTPVFDVKMKAEGALVESWIEDVDSVTQEAFREMETAIEAYMIEHTEAFIRDMQDEFHLDVTGLSEELRVQNHEQWRKMKDEWDGEDGFFKDAEITISADVRIRHFMTKERVF
ncbi:Ger(x)C family spore germination protein [Alteribacter aurantiacus]|uniref:Ger(x)C family spore germination protein n=1 Tax=Alteribacter aurantiacus TaxID=254410 RepID=UPI000402E3B0|nr:Ger(x)C family spore germination protein [Alteribacter aurantiacus]